MSQLMISNQPLTMSSREIAELAGKRHDNVKRSMEFIADKGLITFTQFEEKGNGRPATVYNVNEEGSYIVVAQLSPEFTAKIVKRWRELESQQKPALPTNKELALMVIKAEEEKEAAILEVDRMQGVCNTMTAQFATGMTAPKFCRQLNGVNCQQVNNSLIDMKVLSKTKLGLEPTSYYRDRYFKVSYEEINKTGGDEKITKAVTTLTLKGAKWIYRAYLSGKLPMKKSWDGSYSHVVFEN